jgi:phage shock protein A
MNLFKRLSVSVRSQLDEAVSRIENHDAVIDAALQESRDAIARLKLQQSHLSKKMQVIDTQLGKLSADEKDWIRRAKSLAKTDEEQALACLDRRERCINEIEHLRNKRNKCAEMEFQFSDNISKLEQKLIEDERRLQEFRGRDLSAKAEFAVRDVVGSESNSLEQAFDRWELDITRKEMRQETSDAMLSGSDSFEARWLREERLQARRAELKALMEDDS